MYKLWEDCITLNNSWGYNSTYRTFKSAKDVVRTLVNCVSKGGNFIVNVGPDARGEIPEESTNILSKVGQWIKLNGESIYGCGPCKFPKPEWGRFTQKDNILYVHLLDTVIGHISLQGLRDKIKSTKLLKDGSEVITTDFWNAKVDSFDDPEDIFMNFGTPVQCTFPLPDEIDTVVALEIEGN